MSDNTFESLVCSLEILRESVVKAESLVKKSEKASSIKTNLTSYLEVCEQQLAFARKAQIAAKQANPEQALNYIHLIEKLAELVKQDAEALLGDSRSVQFERTVAH